MALIETLALTIGSGIAKYAIDIWLGNTPTSALQSEAIDFIKNLISDNLNKSQESHSFDAIAKRVVERLGPFFAIEAKHVSDNGKQAIVHQIALTLTYVQLPPYQLSKLQFLPAKLANYLKDSRPLPKGQLNNDETAIYEILLEKISEEILYISNQLNEYDLAFKSKVLIDQEKLLSGLEVLLSQKSAEYEDFERLYCGLVSNKLDKLEYFGIPEIDLLAERQSLSEAYITLEVSTLGLYEDDKPRKFKEFEIKLQNIEQLLSNTRRIILRGPAGSGKSTFLKWLAIRSAKNDFPSTLTNWNEAVPFFIQLRHCLRDGFPKPINFTAQISQQLKKAPDSWAYDILESGRALILIDGVDEFPQEGRGEILNELKDLVTLYPLARYVITSRPLAIKQENWPEWNSWLTDENFVDANFQAMGPSQQKMFLNQWHKSLAMTFKNDDERDEIKRNTEKLERILIRRPAIKKLATNPLLLAMICALYHETGGNLPERRKRLYEDCIKMLVATRDERRGIRSSTNYPLDYDERLNLLQNLAFYMIRNDYTEIDRKHVTKLFNRFLPKISRKDISGAKTVKFFVERTEILQETVQDLVGFTHRTLQEYLAALEISDAYEVGELLNNSEKDTWRETIILAAGEMNNKDKEEFLKGLLNLAEHRSGSSQNKLLLLAMACLENILRLDENVRQLILSSAKRIFPPKDEDEVELIASAGNPAIELLRYNPSLIEKSAGLCIRTLALIGSHQALEAIAEYSKDNRSDVRIEIGLGWSQFESEEYIHVVLNQCKSLVMRDLANLNKLEKLAGLEELYLSNTSLDNLQIIKKLTPLIRLDVSGTLIDDLSPLESLVKLHFLDVSNTTVNNLTPISNLKSLRSLNICNTQVTELEQLKDFYELEQLELANTSVSDILPLKELMKLEYLDIRRTNVFDLVPLQGLINLKFLDIRDTAINDVSLRAFKKHRPTVDVWV